jgi:hypothetical protein
MGIKKMIKKLVTLAILLLFVFLSLLCPSAMSMKNNIEGKHNQDKNEVNKNEDDRSKIVLINRDNRKFSKNSKSEDERYILGLAKSLVVADITTDNEEKSVEEFVIKESILDSVSDDNEEKKDIKESKHFFELQKKTYPLIQPEEWAILLDK